MSKDYWKHAVIEQGKYRKRASKIKWIDREYHVQGNAYVAHKEVRIYCYIAVHVAARPGHPSTRKLCRPPLAGKAMRYVHVSSPVVEVVQLHLSSAVNWNVIHMSPKPTTFKAFEEIHQVVIDRTSDNMASLVQPGKYGTIDTSETATNVFYVIMFISEAYTLQKIQQLMGKYFCG